MTFIKSKKGDIMQTPSFKARIYGLNSSLLSSEFENKTETDYRHSVKVYKDKDTDLDVFILSKDGNPSVKHLNTSILPKNGSYTIEQLIKIFNVLKIREAQNIVLKKKQDKIEHDFINDLQKMVEEEELEKRKKNETIVSFLENTDKISKENAKTLLNRIETI